MKHLALIFVFSFASIDVCANEPDDFFGTLTGLYWCMNKELPIDLEQINEGLGFQLPQNANQANYEKWQDKVKLVIEEDGVIFVRQSDKEIVSSKVNCESVSTGE